MEQRIATLAEGLVALRPRRRRLALFAAGAVGAAALPPTHVLPALLLAAPVLVWAVAAAPTRRAAFGAGFWWSAGWFAVGLYWISNALLTDPVKFGWMIPFAIFGLSSLLAAFNGLATLAVHACRLERIAQIPALAVTMTAAEWVRSWIFTGFPWNPVGSVWDFSLPILQFGALAGIWGLDLVTWLVLFAPAVLIIPGRRRLVAALTLGLPALLALGGGIRLALNPLELLPGITLRIVQANVAQGNKWAEERREANLAEHVALSRRPGFETLGAVIWPETAVSYFLDLDGGHRALAAAAAPPKGLLLTGAPRITPRGVQPLQIWNSLMAVTPGAETVAVYDKVHLVPFGEYVPLRGLLPIAKITHGGTDFSAGPGPATLALPGLPSAAPAICYEAIFPGALVDRSAPRPGWIVNVTNDGWFGISSGPHQHLAASRMRSIEEGLPQARAANTGISAVFDGLGREIALLPLGEKGILDAPLPQAGAAPLYARLGDAGPALLALLTIFAAWHWRRLK